MLKNELLCALFHKIYCFILLLIMLFGNKSSPVNASEAGQDPLDTPMRYAVVLLSMQTCCPDEAWTEAELKVTKELTSNGFQVDREEGQYGTEQELRLLLIRLAKEHNAVSSVMIRKVPLSLGAGIDIWISDQLTERVIVRHISIDEENRNADASTLVGLKTVEALQSNYLEVTRLVPDAVQSKIPEEVKAIARSQTRKEHIVPQAPKAPPPLKRSVFGLGAGGGVAWSPGGFGALTSGGVFASWDPFPYISLGIDAAWASLIGGVAARNVVSAFQIVPFRGWFHYMPLQKYRLRPVIGLGGGGVFIRCKATGSYPYQGRTDSVVVGIVSATSHLLFSVSRYVWLRTGMRVSMLFPEATLTFANYPINRFGRPVIEGFLHLEARFFWPGSE